MPKSLIIASRAAAMIALLGWPALAGTLRCQSVNGNTNCAGSGAISCQTINGRTVCTNGDRDVVQSFGGQAESPADDTDDAAPDQSGARPRNWPRMRLDQRMHGHTLLLDRDGPDLHLRTDRLSIDRTWSAR